MKSIFFKSLWSSRKDYFLVIAGGIFIVSLVFFTTAIGDCLVMISKGRPADVTESVGIVESTFIYCYIFFLLLMILLLLSYLRKRSKDYEMLRKLGIKNRHFHAFVAAEYLGIVIISVSGGILIGMIGTELAKPILLHVFSDMVTEIHYGLNPIKLTMIVSGIIFGLGFMICDEVIVCFGIEAVLMMGKKAGRAFRKSPVFGLLGILTYIMGLFSLCSYWGKTGKLVPTAFGIIAVYLMLLSFGGIYLQKLMKKERKYYRNILWMDNWYHRFFYNMNMTYITAAFLFVIFFSFFTKLTDNYPVYEETNYPYDIVWMADILDENFLDSIEKNHSVTLDKIPCIRVTAPDYGEHTGISASILKEWIGKKVDLKDDEVYIIYQREREQRNMLGIDYGREMPRLHIGKAESFLWLWNTPSVIPSARFDTKFKIAGKEDRILTGIFESRQVEKLHGSVFEDIIVFSDNYYNEVKNAAKGSDLAVLLNISGDYEQVRKEIFTYAKEHSEINFFDHKNGNLIYEKRELLLESSQRKIYNITSSVFNIITLYFCVVFIMVTKKRNDFKEMEYKYHFYLICGMPERKRKKLMKKEVLFPVNLAIIFGMVPCIFYLYMSVLEKHLHMMQNFRYFLFAALGMLAGSIILKIFMYVESCWTIKKIERKQKDGVSGA